jgi:hypothetical protein
MPRSIGQRFDKDSIFDNEGINGVNLLEREFAIPHVPVTQREHTVLLREIYVNF